MTAQPDGIRAELTPESVTVLVEGPRSMVVELGNEELAAEVRIDGLARGTHRLVPIVRVLGGDALAALRIVSVSPEEIDVQIQ